MATPRWTEHEHGEHAHVFYGPLGQPLMQGRRLCSNDYAHGMRLIFENQYGEAPRFPFECACLWCMTCDFKIEYLTYGGPKPELSKNQKKKMNERARDADNKRIGALSTAFRLWANNVDVALTEYL